MRVIILATGEVPTLRPLTETIPAPMVPVVNRPVLEHNIEMLARQGFKELSITLHHLGGSIEAHFGSGRRWGVAIDYHLQRDAWGSAGALKRASQGLAEPFLVLPGDRLVDVDLTTLLAQHRAADAVLTVVTGAARTAEDQLLSVTAAGSISGLAARSPAPDARANVGVYACHPLILNYIPQRTPFDLHADLLPALLADGQTIHASETSAYWNSLNSFPCYQLAQQDLLRRAWRPASNGLDAPASSNGFQAAVAGHRYGPGIWAGRNNIIHPTARIVPPICIGDNCQIGRDVELGPNTIIGTNVIIAAEATIRESTILSNTYVGQLVNVENRFVRQNLMVDALTSENIPVVDSFLLSEYNPAIVGDSLRRWLHGLAAAALLLVTLPLTLLITLLLLPGGRLFSHDTVVGRPPQTLGGGAPLQRTHTLEMLRFARRRWLRRLGLQWLPALWNVVRGDLALVGVKPLSLAEAHHVTEDWQRRRYDYMPGLTGLWYVQTTPQAELDEILVADAFYVATRTWHGDLHLLWRTLGGWLQRRRTRTAGTPVASQ